MYTTQRVVRRSVQSQVLSCPTAQKRTRFEVITSGGRSTVSGIVATVFGSTGFLGRYVVNNLGMIGSQVVVPYRGDEKAYGHMKVMGDLGQIVPMKWDFRDKDSVYRAAEYSNVIINLVGSRYDTRNFTQKQANVDSARVIAEVAKDLGVERFIHVSALGAEQNPSDWGKTKWEGEQVVRSIFPAATILRPATLFGAQDNFLNNHASMWRFWPIYPVFHAKKKLQPVFVDDVARGIVNSLKTDSAKGQTYELGGPAVFTTEEFVEWLEIVMKSPMEKVKVNLSDEMLWHLGYWLGQHRKPRITLDSIKETTDVIVSGKYPGMRALGIEVVPINSELGISFINHYRTPSRQFDVTPELFEIPEVGRPSSEGHYY